MAKGPRARVPASYDWPTNGHLIADVARLYLNRQMFTFDATYGEGTFWKLWRPHHMVANIWKQGHWSDDGPESKWYPGSWYDFCATGFDDGFFDLVVLDPPYKLNGTSSDPDVRYGVDEPNSWQGRHQLIFNGIEECARITKPGGWFLLKCMDQVASQKIRWQTYEFRECAVDNGLEHIDRFDMTGHSRQQPKRTRKDGKPSVQEHAYYRPSTLLVFRKP